MEPSIRKSFSPFYDLPQMVGADQSALASQMHLCRSEQDSWRQCRFLAARAQAYSAQHVLSVVLLLSTTSSVAAWLMG